MGSKSNIICFMSVIPQNGTKYVATNLAYFTKGRYKSRKVLLIDFDSENPVLCFHFVKEEFRGLDNLVANAHVLNLELLKANVVKTAFGVDILKGSSSIDSKNILSERVAAQVLNLAKNIYDYVFIVVNSDPNNPAMAISLLNADKVVLVVRNNYANMLKINKAIKKIRLFYRKDNSISIIYNYGVNNRINVGSIIEDKNVNVLGIIDYIPETVDNVNLESRFFLKRRSPNDGMLKKIVKALT